MLLLFSARDQEDLGLLKTEACSPAMSLLSQSSREQAPFAGSSVTPSHEPCVHCEAHTDLTFPWILVDYANLYRDPASIDVLSTRLITYVVEFLEAHPLDRILALECPTILAALDAAWTSGKQAELAHAVQLFAPFPWRIALPLNSALGQAARKPEQPGASYLLQAVVALADHLKRHQEHGDDVWPSLDEQQGTAGNGRRAICIGLVLQENAQHGRAGSRLAERRASACVLTRFGHTACPSAVGWLNLPVDV